MSLSGDKVVAQLKKSVKMGHPTPDASTNVASISRMIGVSRSPQPGCYVWAERKTYVLH